MAKKYKVVQSDTNMGFYNPTTFNSLEEFIANFPFSERQCIFQITHELNRNGHFIFGDFDGPHFKLYLE